MSDCVIRLARPDEARACRDIHQAARASYLGTAEAWVAHEKRLPVRPFLVCAEEGRLLIALSGAESIGVAAFSLAPPDLHLIELAVLPERQCCGVGTALVEAVLTEAERGHCHRVTLTTYANVPFNAPWFAKRGFMGLQPEAWSGAVRAEMHGFARPGSDPDERVALARLVVGGSAAGKDGAVS